ncbi:MAG TPA: 3-phenylpropionate/cinnamic acid dioxygenase subunit beta, partial [Rubrobacter sp.]|nr:3-phenylpropionate/cinnamic acid dioxygenase subunit beta [Rubrobacter sp.]
LAGGTLTMASIAALPVLIGLAVDYCIQFQARFEELDGRAVEAELLDERREREWLESCIADDVEYLMPVRENRERSEGVGFSDESFYFQETRGSLELRVKRLETEYAWAEDPPSRTRHFVTNIRVAEGEEGEVAVKSNLLLYRSRGSDPTADVLSAERIDVLRKQDDGWRLRRREILLDHSVVMTHNLSVFF